MTRSVRPEDFRSLGENLRDARPLRNTSQWAALIDARSLVRLRLIGGTPSDWIPASDLRVSRHALYLESPIASADLAAATVSTINPEQADTLKRLAPSGGAVESAADPLGETYRLTVSAPETLLPWLARFVSSQREQGASEGLWYLEKREGASRPGEVEPASFPASFAALDGRRRDGDRLFVASGVRWTQLDSLEVHYFDPVFCALLIPVIPVALVLGADPPRVDSHEKPKLPPTVTAASRQVWREDGVQPLFSGQAKRRAIVKLLGGLDGGVGYEGSFFSSATLGLRLRNMFELSFVVRELSRAGGANESRQTHTLLGASAGLHIDGDGDPSFAFYVGVEILGRGGGMTSLVFGPRFGFGNGLFLMVVPVSTSSLCRTDARGLCVGGWRGLYSSVQLGFAY